MCKNVIASQSIDATYMDLLCEIPHEIETLVVKHNRHHEKHFGF